MGVDWNSPKHQADRKRHEAWMKGYQGQPNGDSQSFGAYQMGANMRALGQTKSKIDHTGGMSPRDAFILSRFLMAVLFPLIGTSLIAQSLERFEYGSLSSVDLEYLVPGALLSVIGFAIAFWLFRIQITAGRRLLGWIAGLPLMVFGAIVYFGSSYPYGFPRDLWESIGLPMTLMGPGAFLFARAFLKKRGG